MKKLFTTVIFALVAIAAFAEGYTLWGTVRDAKDGDPLPGGVVRVIGQGDKNAVTNIDGEYELKDLFPGSTILFFYSGYKTIEVTFSNGFPQEYTVFMKKGRGTKKETVKVKEPVGED